MFSVLIEGTYKNAGTFEVITKNQTKICHEMVIQTLGPSLCT